jgi:prepilin-type N-terminal cleavage/methylation domain-containing protein
VGAGRVRERTTDGSKEHHIMSQLTRARRVREAGFTLIELMVVVAIVGVLASLAIPKFLGYMKNAKRTEAEVHLVAIAKAADSAFIENAFYPPGAVAATPAVPCCDQPGKQCAVVPAEWAGVPMWDELGFEMTQPYRFQYDYTSVAAQTYQARAIGDLDCDGFSIAYVMDGDATSGAPSSTLTRPARAD